MQRAPQVHTGWRTSAPTTWMRRCKARKRLGARVTMGATDIPDAGRMAVLADPQGAAFALYSSAGASQSSSSSLPSQEFSWHELSTSEPAAALRFYTELFGWAEVGKHDMGPMGVYHLLGLQGVASDRHVQDPRRQTDAHAVDVLCTRSRRGQVRQRGEGGGRQTAKWPHGGPRRHLDRAPHGPTGRHVRNSCRQARGSRDPGGAACQGARAQDCSVTLGH